MEQITTMEKRRNLHATACDSLPSIDRRVIDVSNLSSICISLGNDRNIANLLIQGSMVHLIPVGFRGFVVSRVS